MNTPPPELPPLTFEQAEAILARLAGAGAAPASAEGPGETPADIEKPAAPRAAPTWSEHSFQQIVESLPDAVVVIDAAGRILLVNAQAEATFGYGRDEMLGQPIELLVPERFRAAHVGHRRR